MPTSALNGELSMQVHTPSSSLWNNGMGPLRYWNTRRVHAGNGSIAMQAWATKNAPSFLRFALRRAESTASAQFTNTLEFAQGDTSYRPFTVLNGTSTTLAAGEFYMLGRVRHPAGTYYTNGYQPGLHNCLWAGNIAF